MKPAPQDIVAPGRFAGHSRRKAFTLIEVMVAIGVFCIGVFAILGLIASVLRNARLLERPMVDASVIASQICQTNQLVEISGFGDLSDFLGKQYQGYGYAYDIAEVQSNKLFQVHIMLTGNTPDKPVISTMDCLFYRPLSPAGSLDGATRQD
jgi:prepilin-type N-terminal cleavage/methylation domain-containing protein